jgi:hypothetical protein
MYRPVARLAILAAVLSASACACDPGIGQSADDLVRACGQPAQIFTAETVIGRQEEWLYGAQALGLFVSLLDPFCGCGVSLVRRPCAPWHGQHDRRSPSHSPLPIALLGVGYSRRIVRCAVRLVLPRRASCATGKYEFHRLVSQAEKH